MQDVFPLKCTPQVAWHISLLISWLSKFTPTPHMKSRFCHNCHNAFLCSSFFIPPFYFCHHLRSSKPIFFSIHVFNCPTHIGVKYNSDTSDTIIFKTVTDVYIIFVYCYKRLSISIASDICI